MALALAAAAAARTTGTLLGEEEEEEEEVVVVVWAEWTEEVRGAEMGVESELETTAGEETAEANWTVTVAALLEETRLLDGEEGFEFEMPNWVVSGKALRRQKTMFAHCWGHVCGRRPRHGKAYTDTARSSPRSIESRNV